MKRNMPVGIMVSALETDKLLKAVALTFLLDLAFLLDTDFVLLVGIINPFLYYIFIMHQT